MARSEKQPNRREMMRAAKARANSDEDAADDGSGAEAIEVAASDAEPPVPTAVLDATVAEIAMLHRQSTLAFALDVGRVVVERLFAGRVGDALRRGPKSTSLKALADRGDLPITARQLYVAVGAYEMLRRIGALEVVTSWEQLSYSHVRALLPAPPEDQERLVSETLDHKWTVEQLEAEIIRVAPKRGGGRPPKAPVVKAADAVLAAVERLEAAMRGRRSLDDAEAERVATAVRHILSVAKKLDERFGG